MQRQRYYKQPARGTVEGKVDCPKLCVRFERPMFDQINDHARGANLSFNEAVRSLIGYAFDKLAEEEHLGEQASQHLMQAALDSLGD